MANIFKAYDIRGKYPEELNEDMAYRIGKAFAKLIQEEKNKKNISVGVANDMRLSSPQLKGKVIQGLIDYGCLVYDMGFVSTPTFYFGIGYNNYDAGIQISASHNPPEYNGLKMVRSRSVPISENTGIKQIQEWVIENRWEENEKGAYRYCNNTTQSAVDNLTKGIPLKDIQPMKIVVDPANSMGILDIEAFFPKLPQIELVKINFEIDGRFPSHEPDPLKEENLEQIKRKVVETKADLGIATDGDADRYFFIDNEGNTVRQEILRGIMAQIAIKENPGATVCYDIRPGKITKDMIEEVGGKASVTKVGHSLIKEQMIKENAVFGGESSGHYFYKTNWGVFEAPFILLAKFLLFVSQQKMKVADIIRPLKKYSNSGEINITLPEKTDKNKILQRIKETYKDGEINELDGVSITYNDFWFNVRASNTEPKMRLTVEAINQKIMEDKKEEISNLIQSLLV